MNEVPKDGLTAAEVVLLKQIHGDDAVVELKCTGEVSRADEYERSRLRDIYGAANPRADIIKETFGVEGIQLPQFIPGVRQAEDAEIAPPVKNKGGRPPKVDPLEGIAEAVED